MKNKLIGMDFAVEVIQTVLLTGWLDDEKPVSLLIIASPESGKTTAARKANVSISSNNKHGDELAVTLTDTTGKGLLKIIREHPKATHVILNDLSIITGHKSHVINSLFSVISALTEEGVVKTADPEGIQPYGEEGLKGVIGCITPRLVRDQRFNWNKTGLTTRMLPFFYRQGFDIQLKVRRYHAELLDESDDSDKSRSLSIPKEKEHVCLGNYGEHVLELAENVARRLSKQASRKNPDYQELGYRRIIQFKSLAKAHSLLTHPGRKEPRVHRST